MKKLITLLVLAVVLLVAFGCEKNNSELFDKNEWVAIITRVAYSDDSSLVTGALNLEKMNVSIVEHLPIYKVDKMEEFERFKEAYTDVLFLNRAYDNAPSFEESTLKYDETFFESNSLLIIYVSAGSGSYRYEVDEIYCDDQSLCVHVITTNSADEVLTADEAGHLITVAIADNLISDCKLFDADLNNR